MPANIFDRIHCQETQHSPLQSIVLGFVVCYVLNKAPMHLLCFLFKISRSTALFHLQIGMNINSGMVIISMDVNRHIDKYLINYS